MISQYIANHKLNLDFFSHDHFISFKHHLHRKINEERKSKTSTLKSINCLQYRNTVTSHELRIAIGSHEEWTKGLHNSQCIYVYWNGMAIWDFYNIYVELNFHYCSIAVMRFINLCFFTVPKKIIVPNKIHWPIWEGCYGLNFSNFDFFPRKVGKSVCWCAPSFLPTEIPGLTSEMEHFL